MPKEQTETETPINEETEETVETTEETTEETPNLSSEEIAELQKKASDYESTKIRAEKAEKKLKEQKPIEKKEPTEERLSDIDLLYLGKTDIHEDDISEVRDYAKFKKISISEAHKALRGVLEQRAEERTTAQATQVKTTQKTSQGASSDTILDQAERGTLKMDTDEDIEKLADARMDRRRKYAAEDRKMRGL